MSTVRKAYAKELASKDKRAAESLVRTLLDGAQDHIVNDIAHRWALLATARELAEAIGSAPAIAFALEELARQFHVSHAQCLYEAVQRTVVTGTLSPPDVVRLLTEAAELAIAQSNFDLAEAALSSALDHAGKIAGSSDQTKDLTRRCAWIRTAIDDAVKLRGLRAEHEQSPSSKQAASELGWHLCTHCNDWAAGLPLLASSADTSLADAARIDLDKPSEPESATDVATRWRQRAETPGLTEREIAALLRRSLGWLEIASSSSRGVLRKRIDLDISTVTKALASLAGNATRAYSIDATAVFPAKRLEMARATYLESLDSIRGLVRQSLQDRIKALSSDQSTLAASEALSLAHALSEMRRQDEWPVAPDMPGDLQLRLDSCRAHLRGTYKLVIDALRSDPVAQSRARLEAVEKEMAEFDQRPEGLAERMRKLPPPVIRGSMVEFGDPTWEDFEFVVLVRVASVGPKEFTIYSRVQGANSWGLNAGGWGLSNRDLRPHVKGEADWGEHPGRRWLPDSRPTKPGDQYSLSLLVRGVTATAYSDGKELASSSNSALAKGRVAIDCWDNTTFLDVRVRLTDGRLVWKGVPAGWLSRTIPPPMFVASDAIEGEELKVLSVSGGEHEVQSMTFVINAFSRDAQRWWKPGKPGDKLVLALPVTQPGEYRVSLAFCKADDYGIVQCSIRNLILGQPFDGYSQYIVSSGPVVLGNVQLPGGQVPLTFELVGKNQAAKPGYMFGLDYVRLERIR